jgi:hypothetical protein
MLDVGIAMDIEMTNLTPIALPLVGKKEEGSLDQEIRRMKS